MFVIDQIIPVADGCVRFKLSYNYLWYALKRRELAVFTRNAASFERVAECPARAMAFLSCQTL